jgi:hypothetical protein
MPGDQERQSSFQYAGFSSPNGTIVPDDVFDVLLPRLTDPELRVLLYIIRRTFGFKKHSDNISLKQMVEGIRTRDGRELDGGTGMSKASVARGLRGLTDKGVIIATRNSSRERGDEPTTYQLRFRPGGVSHIETGGVSQYETGVSGPETGPVSPVDPQETVRQQTEQSLSNIRKTATTKDELLAGTEQSRDNPPTRQSQPLVIGELVAQRTVDQPRGSSVSDADRDTILEYISDFSREFADRASLKSSTTRAHNLYRQSGVALETFIEGMYRARSIVKERTGSIRRGATDEHGRPMRNKMAYWFTVLEDLLGLRETPPAPPTPR